MSSRIASFCLLVVGDVVGERDGVRDDVERLEPRAVASAASLSRASTIDAPRRRAFGVEQVVEGGHRVGVRHAQVQRVVVEAHAAARTERTQPPSASAPSRTARARRTGSETRRANHALSNRARAAPRQRRLEQRDERRQHRQARDQRDHDPAGRDHAELRDADEVGRREGEEADRDGRRADQEREADVAGGRAQASADERARGSPGPASAGRSARRNRRRDR